MECKNIIEITEQSQYIINNNNCISIELYNNLVECIYCSDCHYKEVCKQDYTNMNKVVQSAKNHIRKEKLKRILK